MLATRMTELLSNSPIPAIILHREISIHIKHEEYLMLDISFASCILRGEQRLT